ncbi:hypothetical protein [Qiania dongpingensis]|uniref:Uncharacterized protein n=1 Tax=Qiania dongpingensis TaxID=2763669 RepID=A0A7G9G0Z9_9FIRM|nr:hypothetical protein [Qiania dongpingensis]QNM04481.1 hypothetical protein H9Q78_08270 [Qiania dongpingensis]
MNKMKTETWFKVVVGVMILAVCLVLINMIFSIISGLIIRIAGVVMMVGIVVIVYQTVRRALKR